MGTRSLTYVEESWETCVADEDIWDLIAENELEQMDISNDNWEIHELTNTK